MHDYMINCIYEWEHAHEPMNCNFLYMLQSRVLLAFPRFPLELACQQAAPPGFSLQLNE